MAIDFPGKTDDSNGCHLHILLHSVFLIFPFQLLQAAIPRHGGANIETADLL